MTLEDTLGLGRTLLDVIKRANGNIEQYCSHLSAKVNQKGRATHELADERYELQKAARLYEIERRIKAKFTLTPKGIELKPYIPDETQDIPTVPCPKYDGD